jgi:spore coat polysaccharide biosynthesis predicted glycosyltransferase SpsG
MMKIAFVTDGGSKIGMGHIQQSTTLARELISHTKSQLGTSLV